MIRAAAQRLLLLIILPLAGCTGVWSPDPAAAPEPPPNVEQRAIGTAPDIELISTKDSRVEVEEPASFEPAETNRTIRSTAYSLIHNDGKHPIGTGNSRVWPWADENASIRIYKIDRTFTWTLTNNAACPVAVQNARAAYEVEAGLPNTGQLSAENPYLALALRPPCEGRAFLLWRSI